MVYERVLEYSSTMVHVYYTCTGTMVQQLLVWARKREKEMKRTDEENAF
jgi:hypothetical protein